MARTPHGVPLVIENAHRCQEQAHHHEDGHGQGHSHERPSSPPATYYEPIITQIVKPSANG